MLRRFVLAGAALLLVVGISGCGSSSTSTPSGSSQLSVVGTTASGESSEQVTTQSGVASNTWPRQAFLGEKGVDQIKVSSGTPGISRDQAIAVSKPKQVGAITPEFVSAVHVTLPATFLKAIGAPASSADAWIVSFDQVVLPDRKPGADLGGETTLVDAKTGQRFATSLYPAP